VQDVSRETIYCQRRTIVSRETFRLIMASRAQPGLRGGEIQEYQLEHPK
jgi:hypothetical protein